jgi:hypothetical protein
MLPPSFCGFLLSASTIFRPNFASQKAVSVQSVFGLEISLMMIAILNLTISGDALRQFTGPEILRIWSLDLGPR